MPKTPALTLHFVTAPKVRAEAAQRPLPVVELRYLQVTTETAIGAFANGKFGAGVSLEKVVEVTAERTLGIDLKRTWGTASSTERTFKLYTPGLGLKATQITP